jgi:uncharacterized protein YcfL
MKKVSMGLVHLVFMMVIVLFLIVTFSSCNSSGNVTLNGKDLVIEKLRGIHVPTGISLESDTSNVVDVKVDTTDNIELTGDFRYYYLLK